MESSIPAGSGGTPQPEPTSFVTGALGGGLAGQRLDLAQLVENTPDAVILLDLENRVRTWNRGASEMLGYAPEEVLGRHVSFLLPGDLLQCRELERLQQACERDGSIYNLVTRRLRQDGSQIWVSLTRTLLRDGAGEPVAAMATLRDLSEERAREQELRRARELALVGELAEKVAHEVKNPLAGIFAALQVLEGELEEDDPRREVFASIAEEVLRLDGLTRGLLEFARPVGARPVTGDLGMVLEGVVRELEQGVGIPEGVRLTCVSGPLFADFDPVLTAEAFKCVLANAVDAVGAKGSVEVSATVGDRWVAVDVADSGPGVPRDLRERIFQPFFTTKARGTGLGLAIARKHLEVQGGVIRLRRHRARGAVIRIELPRPVDRLGPGS